MTRPLTTRTVTTLALLLALVALPVSAAQLLGQAASAPTLSAAAPGASALGVLLADPFHMEMVAFTPATRAA